MDDQALIIVALVAVAGFVAWGASQNPIERYGGLQGTVQDSTYEEFVRTFRDFEQRVNGNLSGPPGLDVQFVGRIKSFREDVRRYSETVDELTAPDVRDMLEKIFAQSGGWLDRQASIEAQQEATLRQMKNAPHAGTAVRNPLRKPINTTNDKFRTPGPFDQPSTSMAPRTQTQAASVDPNTGRFYNAAPDNQQVGMGSFQQGNDVNGGHSVPGIGSGTKLNFGNTTFMQIESRPNMLERIAESEMETGVTKPLAIMPNPKLKPLPRSPSASPPPSEGGFGTFGDKAWGMESMYGEIDFSKANIDPKVAQERPPAKPSVDDTPMAEKMAIVNNPFNQQGDFHTGTEESRIQQMRDESKEFANAGDMAQASKLERAADTKEFGTALVPVEKSPEPRSAFDTLDREYMAQLAEYSKNVEVQKDPDNIRTFLTSIEQLVPRRYRGRRAQEWLQPVKGSDVIRTPEYREFLRVRNLAQSKLGGARPRSESFLETGNPKLKSGKIVPQAKIGGDWS